FFSSRPTPTPTLFPYTTLFRSRYVVPGHREQPLASVGQEPKRRLDISPPRGRWRLAEDHDLVQQRDTVLRCLERRVRQLLGRERSEEHTSELQSLAYLVCRLLL